MSYIYLLHVDVPMHHAHHYAGATESLKQRLQAHADGHGAHITAAYGQQGHTWRLAALGLCARGKAMQLERALKQSHNLPRYCPFCTPNAGRIPGTTPYDVALVPFPISSDTLVPTKRILAVRAVEPTRDQAVLALIKTLMKKDKNALGYIPVGGAEGLQYLYDRAQILVCSANDEDLGYLAYTLSRDQSRASIQQCCVRDDARLLGHGKALVALLSALRPSAALTCHVRSDLPANFFWPQIGFDVIRQKTHRTSGSTLIQYLKPPLSFLESRREELRSPQQPDL